MLLKSMNIYKKRVENYGIRIIIFCDADRFQLQGFFYLSRITAIAVECDSIMLKKMRTIDRHFLGKYF